MVDLQCAGKMSLSRASERQEELHLPLFSFTERLITELNCQHTLALTQEKRELWNTKLCLWIRIEYIIGQKHKQNAKLIQASTCSKTFLLNDVHILHFQQTWSLIYALKKQMNNFYMIY